MERRRPGRHRRAGLVGAAALPTRSPRRRSDSSRRRIRRSRPGRTSSGRRSRRSHPGRTPDSSSAARSARPYRSLESRPMNTGRSPSRPSVRAALNDPPPRCGVVPPSGSSTKSTSASPATTIAPGPESRRSPCAARCCAGTLLDCSYLVWPFPRSRRCRLLAQRLGSHGSAWTQARNVEPVPISHGRSPKSSVESLTVELRLWVDGSGSTQVAGAPTDHPRRRPPRQGRGRDRLARAERQPARQRGRAPARPPDDRRAGLPPQLHRAEPLARADADDRRGGAVLHERLGARAAARRRRAAPRPRATTTWCCSTSRRSPSAPTRFATSPAPTESTGCWSCHCSRPRTRSSACGARGFRSCWSTSRHPDAAARGDRRRARR